MQNYQIEEYISEVSRLLPYPMEQKKEALNILRADVSSAMKDSSAVNSVYSFGNPVDVAKDIVEGQEWHTQRAGWGVRIIAWGIDLFIKLSISFIILGIAFVLMLSVMSFEDLIQEFAKWETEEFAWEILMNPVSILSFLSILPATILFLSYNLILEYYFSATIGKKLLGLKAVDYSGIKMVGRQVIIRNLSKIVLGEFLILDVILGMILEKQTPERTQNQRGLDILAETIVIKIK